MKGEGGLHRRGRKPSGDPCKKLSIAPRLSEYIALKKAAEASGKTFARFMIDAALEKIADSKAP